MGNYNAHAPYILGPEWVPIRDEDQLFSPAVNSVEVGHGFTLPTARTLQDARFYVNEFPDGRGLGQTFLTEVYAQGTEDQSGPVGRVIIPCNSGSITGGSIGAAPSVAAALADPSDTYRVQIFTGATGQVMDVYFAVNQYAQLLNGKRILGVNLLYALVQSATLNFLDVQDTVDLWLVIGDDAAQEVDYASYFAGNFPHDVSESVQSFPTQVYRIELGEIDPFWSVALSPFNTPDRMPWTYPNLQRFEASAANRHAIRMRTTATATGYGAMWHYMALEVLYCEEKRLSVGGRAFGRQSPFLLPNWQTDYVLGANIIPMRTTSQAANPVLSAGAYSLVLSSADVGNLTIRGATPFESKSVESTPYPELNALRELYQIPPHPGVQVDIPFPMDETAVGKVFTETVTHILPQLSLHASGGTLTEPHVYGRQGAAQVYGVNTATQDIYDDISGVAASYPQVRFYGRRFGDTTIPLTLTGVGGLSGSTVSITVAEFDALAEILDGWKEITLRFAAPPSMGAVAGNPAWTWSATSETAGNRWELLAACAPAISGVPGNLFNLVPAPNQLGAATYQPPAGDTVELTWMPQGVASPYVSGATIDPACDAVLIFSQDPPTVTGVGLTQLSQTVTGIGLDCGSLPCCIPSGIGYQRIAWSATSLPSTGFGAYELQRWDHLQDDFETIMLATNPALVGFNDYEARVGINSVYRIRTLNVLNFAGAWSAQVTGAPPTPGVTGGCDDQTGALIFTSNADQSGLSNAAYVMQWDGAPTEDFALPEAGMVDFQPMYGRDGSVAFHGTERGLETFSRTLLIQGGAIDPIRLADVKTLRDLAWADLPYVCVRDDIGDRWFANVRIPTVNARHNRTKYMARVDITELTVCPFAVDP